MMKKIFISVLFLLLFNSPASGNVADERDPVSIIKEAIASSITENADIKYKGAGAYSVRVKSLEYKDAEKDLKSFVDSIIEFIESHNSTASFARAEK